jgi:hypothetical protein
MKLGKIIAGLLLTIGVSSEIHSETLDLSPYNKAEYTADSIAKGRSSDDFLRVINASSAWARGYTGKGSTVLIIDSGINASHKEFLGSITHQRNFIGSRFGMSDRTGHGSGLAGIVGANWDGTGMVGIAPDANLAIAKVTDNTAFNFSQARNALVWGNEIGAVVANISANINYDKTYQANWIKLSDGSFYNKDTRYKGGYYGGENPYMWAESLGKNMVLVNSAGNSGLAYPQQPGTLATAIDKDGKLILGGQVLIVGAWDISRNGIASFSNRAGNICRDVSASNTCNNPYKISDFYIMAPGNMFTTDDIGNNYVIQTGTSQAAAVVSGAVAIVNQQWPQMTASNIVKLLTATANKNIAGYNPEVHGQGLLDMEAATRPYGVVGIPTTGRTKVLLSGGFSTSTSGGLSALNGKLSSVMVTDEFDRDYYVDMSKTANNKTARANYNPVAKAQFYENYNPYNKLNYYSFSATLPAGDYDMKIALNDYTSTAMFDMGKLTKVNDAMKYRVGFGMMNENNAWMGNSIGGSFGEVNTSYTQFTNFSSTYNLNKHVSVFGSAWLGYTTANLTRSGLVTDVGATQSYSWNMGLDYTREAHSFGATVSQPVTVYKGDVSVAIPTSYSADGAVNFSRERVSIRPDVNEYDFGMYYKYKTKTMSLITYGEQQMNYLNQSGVNNQQVGFALAKEF